MEKIILITGATSGIGKATALEFLRRGERVLIGARNERSGVAVREEFRNLTGRDAEVVTGDLSSLASVHGMADTVRKAVPHLDILINNAAVYKSTRQLTEDGFELMFGTNHLAPFLLTHLLLDTLKASGHARVLNITAPSTSKLIFEDLQSEKNFNSLNAFGASKMANLLFTFDLARRLSDTGITVNAIHPGLARSNIMGDANLFMRLMSNLFSGAPEKAAQGIVRVALGEEYASQTGKFFTQGREIQPAKYAFDRNTQQKLWDASMKLAGL